MPVSEYTRSYNSFSGVDIKATFGGKVIGELQGVSYSVTREKAPIYTMGSADPRSFSRGKRGIAGTLIFTIFDRSALLETFKGMDDKSGWFFAHGRSPHAQVIVTVLGRRLFFSAQTARPGSSPRSRLPARN